MRTLQNLQVVLIVIQLVQAIGLALLSLEFARLRHDLDMQAL